MIIPYFDVASDVRIRVHHLTPNADRHNPVVVMCHPTGFCASVYTSVSAHLRGLNVYAIDIRSHGYSESGDVTKWSGFAKDLEAAFSGIADSSGHTQFFGVGISSGSSAHILNAAKFPELYLGLYLCEPILFPPGADLSDRDKLAASARNRRDTFDSIDDAYVRFKNGRGLSSLNQSALALYCTHGFKNDGDKVSLRCSKKDEEAIYLSGGANGVYEALSMIETKSKIIYGEVSTTITKQRAEMIAGQMKNATVEELVDAGHFTLFEKPLQGAKSIKAFIDTIAPEAIG